MTPFIATLIAGAIGLIGFYFLIWKRRAGKKASESTFVRETSGVTEDLSELWHIPKYFPDGGNAGSFLTANGFTVQDDNESLDYLVGRPLGWKKFDMPPGDTTKSVIYFQGKKRLRTLSLGFDGPAPYVLEIVKEGEAIEA